MAGYLSIPVLAIAVILQATVMPELRIQGGMPDLVLLLVLAWSLMGGFEQGIIWAIVGGMLQDLISAAPLGTTSLALVIAIAAMGLVMDRINPRSLLLPPVAAVVATGIVHGVTLVVLLLIGRPMPVVDMLLYVTLPGMVYNGLFMVPLYRIVGSVYLSARPRGVEGV
jgi:rod shape-determining protein MreD